MRIVVTISIMIACGVGGVLLWSHGLLHAAGRAAPSATSLIDGRLPIRLEVVTPPGQQIEGLREVVAQWLEMNRCRVVPLDAPFPVSAPPKLVVRIVRDPAENVAFFYVSLELWNFVPIDSKFTEAMTWSATHWGHRSPEQVLDAVRSYLAGDLQRVVEELATPHG